MRKKNWKLWGALIASGAIVSFGGNAAFTHAKGSAQRPVHQVEALVQSTSKAATKKGEEKISKLSTVPSTSEASTPASQTEKYTTQADLKAFNQKATTEEVYVKYPYGRTMNFERATTENLKALEQDYQLKGMANLRDDYDGQTKSVIIFE